MGFEGGKQSLVVSVSGKKLSGPRKHTEQVIDNSQVDRLSVSLEALHNSKVELN